MPLSNREEAVFGSVQFYINPIASLTDIDLLWRGCGSEVTERDVLEAEKEFQDRKDSSSLSAPDAAFAPVEIEVYWHVVAANTTISGGWIP